MRVVKQLAAEFIVIQRGASDGDVDFAPDEGVLQLDIVHRRSQARATLADEGDLAGGIVEPLREIACVHQHQLARLGQPDLRPAAIDQKNAKFLPGWAI